MAAHLSPAGQGGHTPVTLGVVLALGIEYRPLRRHFRFAKPTRRRRGGATVVSYRAECAGGTLVVARAGVGPDNAAHAVTALIDQHRVFGVLCAGLGGALDPDLRPADMVVASDTLALPDPADAEQATVPPPFASDPGWHDLALRLARDRLRAFPGRVVTSPQVVVRAADKRRLHEVYGASAVDMESAAVAAVAHRRGRPFLAIRASSDDAHGDLPGVLARWSRAPGATRTGPRARGWLPSPRDAVRLMYLAAATRRAATELAWLVARFAEAVLDPNRA